MVDEKHKLRPNKGSIKTEAGSCLVFTSELRIIAYLLFLTCQLAVGEVSYSSLNQSIEILKMVLLFCQMCDINSKSRGNA